MKLFKNFALALALIPMTAVAQEVSVTFDTEDYKSLGVYDTWEESPFRLGEMTGNWAVVDNDDKETVNEATGTILNASDKLLAVQRSRFGSNTFGARIDLKQTFELTTAYKYVHVLIKKPVEGRVMLIGLGKRQDRAGQSPRAEQFWSISNNKVAADTWTDAVFAINGNGGIDIHSLVVVPDMESPHERTSDFACFIDEIIVDNSSAPRFRIGGDYALNFENDVKTGRTDRALNSVSFSVPSKTGQSVTSTDGSDKSYLYYDRTGSTFYAKPGETVTPGISYTGSWMNGFVYIDWNSDGKFTNELNANYTPATGSEIVSFNAYSPNGSTWYKSTGATASNGNNIGSGVPTFTIPASQAVGFYRMRYKVDWNSLDAAGCNESGNLITNNGGAILDIMLNIHADEVTVNNANRNGDVLAADGTKLDNYKTAFGQSFTVKMVPENGFGYQGILLTHGYNLNGDSLVHSNAQYRTEYIDRALFTNDEYAIPAEYVDGDILIEGLFVEAGTEVDRTVTASGSHGEMTASDITSAVAKNGHVYVKMLTVSNSCTDYYMAYDKTQTYSDNVVLVIAPSSTDPTVYTIKNLGTGQYFGTANGTSSNSLTSVTTNEAEAATFNIVDRTSGADVAPYNDGTYKLVSFALSTVTSSTMYLNCNNADAHPKYFTGTGGFSLFCVYNVPETPSNEKYTVTYKVKDATGTVIKTSEQEVAKGSTYPAATTITSECSSTYYTLAGIPTSTVEKDTVVVLTYTENFPFEVTKDLAAAKVYRLMFTSDQFYLYNTTSDMALAATSEDTTSDKYGWYFMGNAFDGFQLFNVEAGTGYVLSSSTTMSGTTGGGTRPTLTALPVPTGNNSTWYVQTGNTINGQTGFYLGQTGYASNRMNYRDGYLSYWTGGTGTGSTFTLSEVEVKNLSGVIPGDVNANGEISLSDLTTLIGIFRNSIPADGKNPDVDNNTEVTLDDITALVNIILGR